MNYRTTAKVRQLSNYKIGWVIQQVIRREDITIEDYAEFKGYKPGWIYKTKERLGID